MAFERHLQLNKTESLKAPLAAPRGGAAPFPHKNKVSFTDQSPLPSSEPHTHTGRAKIK